MPRITDLPDGEDIQDGDLFVVSQSGLARKVSWSEIFARFNNGLGGAADQDVPNGMIKGFGGNFATAVPGTDYPGLSVSNTFTLPQTLPVVDRGGQVFDVRAFGADPTGTHDSQPAIQAAIDAASANPYGGVVFVPTGQFLCSKALIIQNPVPYNNPVTLRGASTWSSILYFPGNPNLVSSFSVTGHAALLNFTRPHGLAAGATIRVAGMNNTYLNGSYSISAVPTTTSLKFTLTQPDVLDTPERGWVNRQALQYSISGNNITFTFAAAHGFQIGDILLYRDMPAAFIYLSGTFPVTARTATTVTGPLNFQLAAPDQPTTAVTGTVEVTQGVRLQNATQCIVEELYIKGTQNSAFGINVSALTEHVLLNKLQVGGPQNAICVGGDTADDVSEVIITGCFAGSDKGTAYLFGNGIMANVLDVYCYGCTARNSDIGVNTAGAGLAWFGGSTLGNAVTDFMRSQVSSSPVVIDGIRSEGSYRFWSDASQSGYANSVCLRNIFFISGSPGVRPVIAHNTGNPIQIENFMCPQCGPVGTTQLSLGFDVNYPCRAVVTNLVTDNPNPFFNVGPHVDLTVLGAYVLNSIQQLDANAVISKSKFFSSPVTLPVVDHGGQVCNVKAYGANGQGIIQISAGVDATGNNGTDNVGAFIGTVFDVGSPSFIHLYAYSGGFSTTMKVGMKVWVCGCGTSGGVFQSTITQILNDNVAVMADAATNTATSASFVYGYDDLPAFNAACIAAGGGKVYVPAGNYLLGGTLSLSGRSCCIEGAGDGSVLAAVPAQTGPVVDFTGYASKPFGGTVVLSGVAIHGDGLVGTAKIGLRVGASFSMIFRDILIKNTGGNCVLADNSEMTLFENLFLIQPIGVVANDVAYFKGTDAANANWLHNITLRGTVTPGAAPSVGVSGALVFVGGSTFAPSSNFVKGLNLEDLYLPTNGTIVYFEGNGNSIEFPAPSDCGKVAGATNTKYIKLGYSPVGDGGNVVYGVLQGTFTDTYALDMGVEIQQYGNLVHGVRSYGHNFVVINNPPSGPPVTNCGIQLWGGVPDSPGSPGVVDNSGTGLNYWDDAGARTRVFGGIRTTYGTAAPTTGAWNRGDQVVNTAPSAGGFLGWVCTTAGSPGTWKGFGVIES